MLYLPQQTPTAPTPAAADNSTQIATTAFVQSEAASASGLTAHEALRSSSTVFGHAKMYVSGGDLYIETT